LTFTIHFILLEFFSISKCSNTMIHIKTIGILIAKNVNTFIHITSNTNLITKNVNTFIHITSNTNLITKNVIYRCFVHRHYHLLFISLIPLRNPLIEVRGLKKKSNKTWIEVMQVGIIVVISLFNLWPEKEAISDGSK
jgi:hypothetical protein